MAECENTPPDLRSRVGDALSSSRERASRPLEEYLRALWAIVCGHSQAELRWDQIGEWLVTALTAPAAPFDEAWLSFRDPPGKSDGTPREEFNATSLFQIADLHRMEGGALGDEWREPGVESPAGHTWYNFDALSYLECGLAGLSASNEEATPLAPG